MTGTQEPAYTLLKTIGTYEIRHYSPYVIAEVPMSSYSDNSESFQILARYIGVFGTAANEKRVSMAMTAPVITQPVKIKMTAPVISSAAAESMSFVLPFEFQDINEVPKPTDKRISIRHIPKRILASYKYSGSFDPAVANNLITDMIEYLKKEKLVKDSADRDNSKWEVAQYHPPFTLPFMRRNEVWLVLDPNNEMVKELTKSK
jgi:hypothetical protein